MKHLLIGIITIVLISCNPQNKTNMSEQSKKVGTVELVIFDTYPQYSKAEVIAAAKAVNPVVEKFDGYIGRKLTVDKNGKWTDIVYWTDLKSAEHAAQEILKSETCQKFFGMINQETMQFMHLEPVIDVK
ncbi:hypothetical protein [uncultured Kordia sp.]|uniref:hypothetical protein n=1 Tax=uncultured Kordia sp. TaxID=507699 RepID=UPI0026088DA2|nr:hypothetical protein [uncultured Kordia sp.]